MQKTKIEWCDYTWNPVKGLCPQACWYCYARAMYKRFKWDTELRLNYTELTKRFPIKPSRIFVGSTIDLFHPQIPSELPKDIIREIRKRGEKHTFLFLTKNPARYAEFDFPENCWLGVTVTKEEELGRIEQLWERSPKNLIFVSFEPLLGPFTFIPKIPDWVIIGALTGPKAKQYAPRMSWIAEIRDHAHDHNVPVFEKNNLKAVWGEKLIQEYPERSQK